MRSLSSMLFIFSLSGLFLSAGCKHAASLNSTLMGKDDLDLSVNDRLATIAAADTWLGDEAVSSKNLLLGPDSKLPKAAEAELSCDFVEPDPLDPPGGRTPKFECAFDVGGKKKVYKVKYDPASVLIDGKAGSRNLEVWGEVLSTRLLWSLGFPADRIYPARITCRNCPLEPWTYVRQESKLLDAQDRLLGFIRNELLGSPRLSERADRRFPLAVIEIKYDAPKIESAGLKGWSWQEIYQNMKAPEQQGLQRDALTILAAFMNHMDNKAEQQRLICASKEAIVAGQCSKPLLMIQDAGSSFGNGWAPFQGDVRLNKVDLVKWTKLSLWADAKNCEVKLNGAPNASFRNKLQVSEAARAFVARLMSQLSDAQILDLFRSARMQALSSVSNEEWAAGFKAKVQRDLLETRCPL